MVCQGISIVPTKSLIIRLKSRPLSPQWLSATGQRVTFAEHWVFFSGIFSASAGITLNFYSSHKYLDFGVLMFIARKQSCAGLGGFFAEAWVSAPCVPIACLCLPPPAGDRALTPRSLRSATPGDLGSRLVPAPPSVPFHSTPLPGLLSTQS